MIPSNKRMLAVALAAGLGMYGAAQEPAYPINTSKGPLKTGDRKALRNKRKKAKQKAKKGKRK